MEYSNFVSSKVECVIGAVEAKAREPVINRAFGIGDWQTLAQDRNKFRGTLMDMNYRTTKR